MAFNSIREIVDAYDAGRVRRYSWRKNPTQTTVAGQWFDLSMSPGNPPPKYWFDAPPLIAKAISQSADGGLFHGANVSPSEKFLRIASTMVTAATALPLTITLVITFQPANVGPSLLNANGEKVKTTNPALDALKMRLGL